MSLLSGPCNPILGSWGGGEGEFGGKKEDIEVFKMEEKVIGEGGGEKKSLSYIAGPSIFIVVSSSPNQKK